MIYHIAQNSDWVEALNAGIYLCESLESEGFIHCSTETQVIRTANRIFTGRTDLILLQIDEESLIPPLVYESAKDAEEQFPHIYGPINLDAITRVEKFLPQPDQTFMLPQQFIETAFWQIKPLNALTQQEWESLCDGCARCCLYKIQDIDTDELLYTQVACRYLNPQTCRCTDYENRNIIMPTCIPLNPQNITEIQWMPNTCAYRLLAEGKPLRWWHPLISGSQDTVNRADISIKGHYLPELEADLDHLEDYVIEYPNMVD